MKNCADRQLRRHGGPTWRAGGFWGGESGGLGVLGVRVWKTENRNLANQAEKAPAPTRECHKINCASWRRRRGCSRRD